MHDILGLLKTLRRPRLLTSAARAGVAQYDRAKLLPRILGDTCPRKSGQAALQLFNLEAELNDRRLRGSADYTPRRHVEVLIALMGEAQLLTPAPRT